MQSTEQLLIDRDRLARRLEGIALAMLDGVLPRSYRTGMSLMGLGDLDSKCRTAAQRIAHELDAHDLYSLMKHVEIEARQIRDPMTEEGRGHLYREPDVVMIRIGDRLARIIREVFTT